MVICSYSLTTEVFGIIIERAEVAHVMYGMVTFLIISQYIIVTEISKE
jgi:hypothetical protein